jgi:hypothetical protein
VEGGADQLLGAVKHRRLLQVDAKLFDHVGKDARMRLAAFFAKAQFFGQVFRQPHDIARIVQIGDQRAQVAREVGAVFGVLGQEDIQLTVGDAAVPAALHERMAAQTFHILFGDALIHGVVLLVGILE